jgi:hypothetical protein
MTFEESIAGRHLETDGIKARPSKEAETLTPLAVDFSLFTFGSGDPGGDLYFRGAEAVLHP